MRVKVFYHDKCFDGASSAALFARFYQERIAGDADFLLQVVARDLDAYAEFAMTVVRRLPRIKEMQTTFVLKEIKPMQGLPIQKGRL